MSIVVCTHHVVPPRQVEPGQPISSAMPTSNGTLTSYTTTLNYNAMIARIPVATELARMALHARTK
jgi:hypothetical protein